PGRRVFYLLSLAVSGDGRTLAVGQSDGNATVYGSASGQVRRILRGHRESIPSLAFTSGARLVTASLDHTALVWDVSLKRGGDAPAQPLADKELRELWKQVADPKAESAF